MSSRQTARRGQHISSEKILTIIAEDDLSLRYCDSLRCVISRKTLTGGDISPYLGDRGGGDGGRGRDVVVGGGRGRDVLRAPLPHLALVLGHTGGVQACRDIKDYSAGR